MPSSETNPIAGEMESVVPVSKSASTPPLTAAGMPASTTPVSRSVPTAE